jgi:ATP-dependent Zn protease
MHGICIRRATSVWNRWASRLWIRSTAYLGHRPTEGRTHAEGTQLAIDEEVGRILSNAGEKAHAILTERRASLDAVIDLLLEKETISGVEVMDAVRRSVDTAKAVAVSG